MEFDPAVVSYDRLLELFWQMHNPAPGMFRDPDSQYRSAIYATTDEQLATALQVKERLEKTDAYRRGISTEIRRAPMFWRAEEYHQRYYEKHGVAACRI